MVNHATLHDVVQRRSRGAISRCLGSFWSCSKTCCDSRSCGISKDYRAMSYDVEAHRTIFVQWTCDDVIRLHL